MIELYNLLGTDVAVLGNHEFDFDPDVAAQRIEESDSWLGTNVLGRDGKPALGAVDLHVVDVGGYKIGFFGLLAPETDVLSSPGPDITFAAPVETARSRGRAPRGGGGGRDRRPHPRRPRGRPRSRAPGRGDRSDPRWPRPRPHDLRRWRHADREGRPRRPLPGRGRSRGRAGAAGRGGGGRGRADGLALHIDRRGRARPGGPGGGRPLRGAAGPGIRPAGRHHDGHAGQPAQHGAHRPRATSAT